MTNGKLETRTSTLTNEIHGMQKGWLYDFGHPLINRITESFVKAAGIGAIQAVTREGYCTAVDCAGCECGVFPDACVKKGKLSDLRGENCKKSLEAMVKSTGKESLQWGLAAGVYSGLTYGLREARGSHDWKNSAVAGAITGAALALTTSNPSREQIVQCAITGAALSTAANVLTGIF